MSSLVDASKTVQLFFENCAEAGPARCPFHAATPSEIQRNLAALEDKLRIEPVVVETDTFYGIVDQPTVRFAIFRSLYEPSTSFPRLANALAQLSAGNGTALLSLFGAPTPHECSCDPSARDWDEVNDGTIFYGANDGAEIPGDLKSLQDGWAELTSVSPFSDYWATLYASGV